MPNQERHLAAKQVDGDALVTGKGGEELDGVIVHCHTSVDVMGHL